MIGCSGVAKYSVSQPNRIQFLHKCVLCSIQLEHPLLLSLGENSTQAAVSLYPAQIIALLLESLVDIGNPEECLFIICTNDRTMKTLFAATQQLQKCNKTLIYNNQNNNKLLTVILGNHNSVKTENHNANEDV